MREAAGARGHEQGLQRRERVRGLGEHRPGDEERDVVARLLVVRLLGQPRFERDAVEGLGIGMLPGPVRIHLGDQGVELVDQLDHGLLGGRRHGEDLAGEPRELARLVDVDAVALAIAAVGLQPEVGEGLLQRVLVGRDPLAADLEHRAVDVVGPQPSADAIAGFEHRDRESGLPKFVCGREPGGARPHDDDVAVQLDHCGSSARSGEDETAAPDPAPPPGPARTPHAPLSAAATTSMPSSRRSSEIESGGRNRMTLP